jgi:hypothetical protein
MSGANLAYRSIADLLAEHGERFPTDALQSLAGIAGHAREGRTLCPEELSQVSRLRAEIARQVGFR